MGENSHNYQTMGIFNPNNTQPPAETSVLSLLSMRGRTAIVTGASSGIGLAAAEAFAEAGANVALWYNSDQTTEQRAAEISKAHGVTCKAYRVDVSSLAAVNAATDAAVADLNGRLDAFVANAGAPWLHGALLDDPDCAAHFRQLMSINVDGVLHCALAAGRHFRRQWAERTDVLGRPLGDGYRGGSFVATSSTGAVTQGIPQMSVPYNASKAAVAHLCKGLAVEWVRFARVNCVAPGYVSTKMLDGAPREVRDVWAGKIPMGREGKLNELKGAFLYLASDASSFTTGSDLVVDGGYILL